MKKKSMHVVNLKTGPGGEKDMGMSISCFHAVDDQSYSNGKSGLPLFLMERFETTRPSAFIHMAACGALRASR